MAMVGPGRVINSSFFEKDTYIDEKGREAEPSYKLEMAVPAEGATDEGGPLHDVQNAIYDAIEREWGEAALDEYDNGEIEDPIKDGNELAKKRQAKGKAGDVYENMLVVRAHTLFNRNGENAPGGIYVCGPDAKELEIAERGQVYNGCEGVASVTASPYTISGRRGVTLYLNGFQKTDDGDRIRGSDPSGLFSPMMGKDSAAGGKGRKGRGKR
jgi:hypothetical protein